MASPEMAVRSRRGQTMASAAFLASPRPLELQRAAVARRTGARPQRASWPKIAEPASGFHDRFRSARQGAADAALTATALAGLQADERGFLPDAAAAR
eukprot:7428998-Pyramimonas_sp.AAC.1